MTSISSVTSYQPPAAPRREKEEPLPANIDFVFIFKIKGINLSGADKAVAQLLFNATKKEPSPEFTYEQLEQRLDKCQRTIYRSLKKLAALFVVDFIRSRINSLGYKEYNILKVQRVPDFYQIINQLIKQ